MENLGENSELLARRKRVAGFIQANLQPAKHLLEEGALDQLDEDVSQEAQNFTIFEHQLDAWGALWDARKNGETRALVHLATGLGKTSVAVFDVIKFREEYKAEHGREPRILFTCHQNEILDQAADRFSAFIPDASQGFYNGEEKVRDADLTFATLQSLYGSLDTFDPEEFDYIIYDEAHHSKAETFEAVVNHFNPAFQLALTATPDRLDEENIRELFGHEVYSKGLAQALVEGLLATPDYHITFDDAVKKAMEAGFGAESLRELNELFSVRPRNEVIAQNIKDEMERIGLEFGSVKTILFCQDIDHAKEMARLLGGEAYHSEIRSKMERKAILDDFKSGDLQIICTRDMFNEGVDIPDARLLVFLRSTSSQTIFEQQLGRGLRKHAGKDTVSVLDFVANVERIAMVRELADSVREYTPGDSRNSESGDVGDFDSKYELIVDTGHGEFDFDRLSVDLLEKFEYLRESNSNFMRLTNDELVSLALSLKPDGPLSQREIKDLSISGDFLGNGALVSRFGSLIKFQKACGFEDSIDRKSISRAMSNDEIIAAALELSPDQPLTTSEIDELCKERKFFSPAGIITRFGSIAEFQQACGFQPADLRVVTKAWSNDDVIEIALAISPTKPLNAKQMDDLTKKGEFVSGNTIRRRFGSIAEFHKACGFEIVDHSKLSDDEVIKRALELKSDGPMSGDEVRELSKQGKFIGLTTIMSRFGSLKAFQKACGF